MKCNRMYFACCLLFIGMTVVTGTVPMRTISKDTSKDILSDVESIIVNGIITMIGNCTGTKDSAPETEYWLYTRINPNEYIKTGVLNYIDPSKPIKFLLHGWAWDANTVYIQQLKDVYLQRYDANVIAVNWGPYAQQNYQSAYCAAQGVAKNVANFLCQLQFTLNVSLTYVHIVGHSMGAHIAGIAGGKTQKMCGALVGRITGLDPAGPLFTGLSPEDRLDKTDALFVDVIHTNQGLYGYTGSCGDIDFYPNCGYFQKGCMKKVLKEQPKNLLDLFFDYVSCNHRRSCDYFQESVLGSKFRGVPCLGCGTPVCVKNPLHFNEVIMGEDCVPPISKTTEYKLDTHSTPPYAKQ